MAWQLMKQKWLWAAGVLLAVGVGLVALLKPRAAAMETTKQMIRMKFPDVPQVTTDRLSRWLEEETELKPQLLDVRRVEEFEVSHLPGAKRVDPGADVETVRAEIDPERPVVVYCAVGYRSSRLASRLREAGVTNVFNLEGAIFQWANEGRPVVKNGEPVTEVHPYDTTAGRLLDSRYRADVPPVR